MCIWGGYIDRVEPETNLEDSELKNQIDLCFRALDQYWEGIINFPYFSLFQNEDDEINQHIHRFWKFEIFVTESGRNSLSEILKKVNSAWDEFSPKEIENNDIAIGLARFTFEKLGKKTLDSNEDLDIQCQDEESQILLDKLLEIEFPKSILENFQSSWLLSDDFVLQVFLKYLKYLIVATLNDYKVSPCFWVDQLWHAHMTSTKHYRDTCSVLQQTASIDLKNLKLKTQDFIPHLPGDKSEESKERLRNLCENTWKL